MGIEIRPCSADDGPAIGSLNVTAFWTDPTWINMWPDKSCSYVASQAAQRMAHNLLTRREHRRHLKAVDITTGAVVGYARWVLPHPEGEQDEEICLAAWPEAQVPTVSEEERAAAEAEYNVAYWEFNRALDVLDPPMMGMKDKWMEGRTYLYLEHLAVLPDFRGRGIGTKLIEEGLLVADKMKLDSCVLAMRAGLGAYKRAGFQLLEEVIQDASQFGGEKEYAAYFLERKATNQESTKAT